jgi:hypothetical protein
MRMKKRRNKRKRKNKRKRNNKRKKLYMTIMVIQYMIIL